jgi:hypothetical protein
MRKEHGKATNGNTPNAQGNKSLFTISEAELSGFNNSLFFWSKIHFILPCLTLSSWCFAQKQQTYFYDTFEKILLKYIWNFTRLAGKIP